ncbi:chloride channel protein [Chloropicon primus]|uniref:Chloride channel protein n=2 Tax=Chloropicon primus TaxID=1764295 RepID=A0A5B8MB63_9CHLO|nr:chloride channel protein [Chloropicon primus]|eukprot:QDZ17489.1 chloride channel protein [Chloropicon primus]
MFRFLGARGGRGKEGEDGPEEDSPEPSFVSLDLEALSRGGGQARATAGVAPSPEGSIRQTVSDPVLLRSARLSAMASMRDRGAMGLSTDRFVGGDVSQIGRGASARESSSFKDLEEKILSQFSPYISAAASQASSLGASAPGKSARSVRSRDDAGSPASSAREASATGCAGNLGSCFPNRLRERDFLPSHLHGAPTKRSTKLALEMFQNMQVYDSQNYEPSDSKVDRSAALNLPRSHYYWSNVYRWLLALAIGVTMGLVTFCMLNIMNLLITARTGTTERLVRAGNTPGAIAFFVCLAGVLGLAATLPVALLNPIAGGSGIAEMKVYLNGIHVPGLLRLSTFATKAFSLCCSIPSGMVLGTAGPYVHLGAIVGGGLGSLGSNQFKFKLNKGHVDFQSKFAHRSFVTIGIAAGIATIFTAPIGGVLIAFEDCGSFYLGSTKMFWQCFLATCSGVFVNQLLNLTLEHGDITFFDTTKDHRAFGLYTDLEAMYSNVYKFSWWEVISFAVMGVVAGLAGSLFVYLHMVVHKTRWRWFGVPWKRVIEALAVAVVTAGVAMAITSLSPCSPLPDNIADYPMTRNTTVAAPGSGQNATEVPRNPNFNRLWCPEGSYSSFGTLFLNPAGISLKEVTHLGETVDSQDQFSTVALVAYMLFIYIGLILTYGSAVSGGTMVPLLAAGSCYGRLCAKAMKQILLSMGQESAANGLSYSTYAVIGAASLQSGASRMTMSIAVLVLETFGALELTIPLMITIFFAKAVGDLTGTGLYDAYIALKGVPYLPEDEISYEQKMISEKLDVQEVMTSNLVCLPPVPTIGQVVQVLKTCKHNAFPVLESEGEEEEEGDRGAAGAGFPERNMLGYIFREQLLNMLDKGIGFLEDGETHYDLSDSHEEVLALVEDMKVIPVKRDAGGQAEVIGSLSMEEVGLRIDLRPFMQLDPCIISSTANVAKAYRLFQKMGLSHLYVAPPGPRPIIGVITRKDLTFENCQLQLGERASYEMSRAASLSSGGLSRRKASSSFRLGSEESGEEKGVREPQGGGQRTRGIPQRRRSE